MYHYNYTMRGWYWGEYECKGADSGTFTPHNSQWATDKKGLFNGRRRARVKDPSTIQILNHLFAKDSQQVYYIMGTAKAVVDPASFEVLHEPTLPGVEPVESSCGWARDKINVYFTYRMSGAPKILRKADRNTFQVVGPRHAKDHKYVWATDRIMKGADPATFELINDIYSKDTRCVYYDEAPLPGSDPHTFRVIGPSTGVDKASVYVFRKRLESADPLTYRCEEAEVARISSNLS
jgi:hypothetical protein